jgi:hypothetical protein
MQVFTVCKSDDLMATAKLSTIPTMTLPRLFPVPPMSAPVDLNLALTTLTVTPRPSLFPALLLPGRVQAATPADAVSTQVFTACKSDDLTTMARLTTLLPVLPRSATNVMLTTATTAVRPRPTLSSAPFFPGGTRDVSPADAVSIRAFDLSTTVILTTLRAMPLPRLVRVPR